MTSKQVLRQITFDPIFADFLDDYRFQKVRESAKMQLAIWYTSLPQVIPRMSESSVYHCSPIYRQPVYLPFYSFVTFNCLPVYRRPVSLCLLTADLSTFYLSFYSFVSANCLPVYHLSTYMYVHWLQQTCLPYTCLSIPLYLPTAYRWPVHLWPLTTADLSNVYPFLHLPTAYLSTADLPTYVLDHRRPVY